MRTSFVIFLITALQIQAFAQVDSLEREAYLLQAKRQETAGIVLLAVGGITTIIGLSVMGNKPDPQPQLFYVSPDQGGTILCAIGGVLTVVSIPLLIASGKNRKKAASLSVSGSYVPVMRRNEVGMVRVPTLLFRLALP